MRKLCAPLAAMLVLGACAFFGAGRPPYLVYFQERSARLDASAQDVVALAARRANAAPMTRVEVIGYTDSAGSPLADIRLSQQRAQAVTDALVADGVAADRLVRSGRGQTGENPGIASRRVEIRIGG